jgi:hypothetical protein
MMHSLVGGGLTFMCHTCITEDNLLLAKWSSHGVYCTGDSVIKVPLSYPGTCLYFSTVCASLCV